MVFPHYGSSEYVGLGQLSSDTESLKHNGEALLVRVGDERGSVGNLYSKENINMLQLTVPKCTIRLVYGHCLVAIGLSSIFERMKDLQMIND